MQISRRSLLVAAPLATAMTGCSGVTAFTPAAILSEAVALSKGLAGALAEVAAADPNLIPPATLATLQNDLTLAEGAASALDTALPATAGASIAQKVDGYINAVLTTLAAPPINGLIPSPFNLAVTAAAIVVPEIEAFVNQYLPASMTTSGASLAALAARKRFAALKPAMTVADAVATLQHYAAA